MKYQYFNIYLRRIMGNQAITELVQHQLKKSVALNMSEMKPEDDEKDESSKSKRLSRCSEKCEFVYINPIKLDTFDSIVGNNYEDFEQAGEIEGEAHVQNQPQKEEEVGRILVQWSSFIKIKKKNYLQDYIHVKQIGQGAFGAVSKIKMKYGGLHRVAKIVKKSSISQEKTKREKFISQIFIPMKTDHPNLNKLFEVFEWKNQYVLIMELCEGGDLFTRIKTQKTFTETKVADIMKQILSGVVYLHKNNIVHRDLKPENMLYDNESKLLKITDFGTAIELPPGKKLRNMVGSPYYLAPQVILGEYNEKCDVWSCGVILYIMLSGGPPFFGQNEQEIINSIKSRPLSFDNPIWKKRSKESKKLVTLMLNKNYNQRPSALEVLNSEWISNSSKYTTQDIGNEVVKNLTNFHFQNRLKAVVYTYIASQLYSNKDKEKLLQCFREMDKDGDGVIGKDELIEVFQSHKGQQYELIEIEKILKIVDTNGSGLIDFTQFLVAASNEEQLLEEQRLENAFSYLDTDHSGYITADEIQPFLDNSKETASEINKIFYEVDANGDGKISKKEFVALLLKKH